MERAEHLTWCKKRALDYLKNGDIDGAMGSMLSDMNKHSETAGHSAIPLMMQLRMMGQLNDVSSMRKFIEGFN
jgi:hypothetical protein